MTVGSPLRAIIKFAIPLILGYILQQMYLIIDAAIVGRWIGVGRWKIIGATGVLVREIVHRQRRIVVNRVTCLHKHGSTLVGSITITNYALRAERRKALFSEVED